MSGTGTRYGYTDLFRIEDPDGVVAVISRRNFNGDLAVGVFREYDRDGQTEKTAFLPVRQIDAAIRVLQLGKEKILQEQDREHARARTSGGGVRR
jgi:hypothetical protein